MQELTQEYRTQICDSFDSEGEEEKASYLLGEYVLGIIEAIEEDDFGHHVDDDKVSVAFIRGRMDWKNKSKVKEK